MTATSGTQNISILVTTSSKMTATITVAYAVSPGTAHYSSKATGGGDYGGKTAGTLTFKPGSTAKTIVIHVWPSSESTSARSFTVTLTNLGPGASLYREHGTGTLLRALD